MDIAYKASGRENEVAFFALPDTISKIKVPFDFAQGKQNDKVKIKKEKAESIIQQPE